ncbi:ABC transporter ATP-binding protein [Thetidibacter halocola]|uniref:ABC transporter ATP-binding protein n=1 Tax=Thetidibacter halocola TaxID=2827239 RepID=A0A8J7WG25_9RHOB|nr:ABC transporter ATP-binding protein [Thetidibacter halocola]MBS0125744.1 ABC transporter ATP-binding protein [Thetidibacter halocola]
MSALCDFLEDFSSTPASSTDMVPMIDEAEIEAHRLAAFEEGYRAGWDDAVKAQSADQAALSDGLRQALQDMSFTYHEAYGQMMTAITPLLEDLVQVLLPGMARATLGAHVVQTLKDLSHEIGALDVELAVSPDAMEAVAPLLEQDFGFPIRLVADSALSTEQADLRFGQSERQIDLAELLNTVTEAVQGFVHDQRRKTANG